MIEPGQVWDFSDGMVVVTLRPRPDLDLKFLKQSSSHGYTYWDVLYLLNVGCDEDSGVVDWLGIDPHDSDWVRLF